MKCKFTACYKTARAKGFCARHYNWQLKGWMNPDTLEVYRKIPITSYNSITCKVPNCKNKARRNFFCSNHSEMVRAKRMDPVTFAVTYKAVVRYSKDFSCAGCHVRRGDKKFTKGFCKKCYELYRLNFIDYLGKPTGKVKKRVGKYSKFSKCKVNSCLVKPRSAGFCPKHYAAFRYKTIDGIGRRLKPILAKNAGKNCNIEGCDNPAYAKLLCRIHYRRSIKGYIEVPHKITLRDRACVAIGCKNKAYCKDRCSIHYRRFLQKNGRTQKRKEATCKTKHGKSISTEVVTRCVAPTA